MTEQTLESFVVRNDQTREYATFVVLQRRRLGVDSGYFMVAIASSYGYGYAYAWSRPGGDFYDFLRRRDEHYLCSKFCQGERGEPDWEETCARIRREIIDMRRSGDLDAAKARALWPEDVFDSETAFSWWNDRQNEPFDRIDCAYEYIAYKPSSRVTQFLALHKAFWPAFCEQLRAARARSLAEAAPPELTSMPWNVEVFR